MFRFTVCTSIFMLIFHSCSNEELDDNTVPSNGTTIDSLDAHSTSEFNDSVTDSTDLNSYTIDASQITGRSDTNHVPIEEIELPIEKDYYESVWDDPDYVGTPCQYVDGECVRHQHKKQVDPPKE